MKFSECLPLVFLLSALLFHILAVLSVSVLRLAVVVERYDRPLWPVISFIMKKFIIFCLIIIIFLYSSLPVFSISRYDSYSYWSSAQNVIMWNGLNLISNASYSKTSNLTPPTSLLSEFYQNGYYSNNYTLFTDNASGTASTIVSPDSVAYSWTYNGIDGTSPLDEGFVLYDSSSTVTLSDEGAVIGPYDSVYDKGIYNDSQDKITILNFRFKSTGILDDTNFSFVTYRFPYQGNLLGVTLVVSNAGLSFVDTQYPQTNNGTQIKPFDATIFHDYQLVVNDNVVTLYVDNSLVATITAGNYGLANNDNSKLSIYSRKYVQTILYSVSAQSISKPTTTIFAKLGKSIDVPSGSEIEFYVNLRSGSVTNVTQATSTEFEFTVPDYINVGFGGTYQQTEIQQQDGWLLVNVPSSDSDRTFTDIRFGFITPYVATTAGDVLQFNSVIALSDVVIGNSNDIGYNPDVDPGEEQFRDDLIDGIGDINDSLDSIHDVLTTPPDLDEFNSVMDSVNGIFDEFDRYVFDKYPNFPPIPEAPAPDFVSRLWLIVNEVLSIGIPLQSRNLGWLTFNADDNVFRLSHFIVWFTTIFLTRAFIYAISEATKAKNNPIQGDGDD